MNPNYLGLTRVQGFCSTPLSGLDGDPNDEPFWVKKGTPNDSLSHPKPIKVKGMMLNRQIMFYFPASIDLLFL